MYKRQTLDNSAHTLDIDADEAVIGRKYYRAGESEYTINGQLCRLKDIYELLLDTGIGRDEMCIRDSPDAAADLGQLAHQVRLVVETSGRIGDDHVIACLLYTSTSANVQFVGQLDKESDDAILSGDTDVAGATTTDGQRCV